MKLTVLIALTSLLTFVNTSVADVTKNITIERLTNNTPRLPSTDTNLTNAEKLLETLEKMKEGGGKVDELLAAYDDLARFFESADKEMDMFRGATNLIQFTYRLAHGSLTVMIVNPVESAKNAGVIEGRFHFLYPKEWRVSSSYYEREKPSVPKQSCGIGYRFGTNSYEWSLDLKKPFLGMAPADQKKAAEEFLKFTATPFNKLRFNPGNLPPVWIADYGKEDSAEKK